MKLCAWTISKLKEHDSEFMAEVLKLKVTVDCWVQDHDDLVQLAQGCILETNTPLARSASPPFPTEKLANLPCRLGCLVRLLRNSRLVLRLPTDVVSAHVH